jgi:hypothetical protein
LFAQDHNVLPDGWDCLEACLAGYRNYQAQLPAQTPYIAEHPATLDMRDGELRALSDEDMERHGAFLFAGKTGRTELLLVDSSVRRFFPDWKRLRDSAELRPYLWRDQSHATRQRTIRTDRGKERFACLILTAELATKIKRPG